MRSLFCCKIYALFILLLTAGCAGQSTQYYVLNTISPVQTIVVSSPVHLDEKGERLTKISAAKAVMFKNIAIRQLEIPRYLDRPRIVSRDADNHLRISEYHQWGGRLREDISRTLSDNLAERLPAIHIHTLPFPGVMYADVSLLIDIRQFELLADKRVHLKVRWHIQRTGQKPLGYFDHIVGESNVERRDYAAMAAAMSKVLALLSEKMATEIMRISNSNTP